MLSLVCLALGCRPEPAPAHEEAELVIFGAASLREVFNDLRDGFERAHPGVDIIFNFAGTQELRTQIENGAAADVFASADLRHMEQLVRAGRVLGPVIFARNEPVVIVSREAASSIGSFAELPRAQRLVIGSAEVPIGRYTSQILDRAAPVLGLDFRARVAARVVSRELNVRQVLAKVRLGEADAAIVYRSDAALAPELTVLAIPDGINVVAEYPAAVVAGARHPNLARAWLEHLRSPAARAALERAGFLAPDLSP